MCTVHAYLGTVCTSPAAAADAGAGVDVDVANRLPGWPRDTPR